LDRIQNEAIYQHRVFFIRNLGFVTPTSERQISFEDTLRFERIHEQTYSALGFELVFITAASLTERVNTIKAAVK
jgi:predicted ATPase